MAQLPLMDRICGKCLHFSSKKRYLRSRLIYTYAAGTTVFQEAAP